MYQITTFTHLPLQGVQPLFPISGTSISSHAQRLSIRKRGRERARQRTSSLPSSQYTGHCASQYHSPIYSITGFQSGDYVCVSTTLWLSFISTFLPDINQSINQYMFPIQRLANVVGASSKMASKCCFNATTNTSMNVLTLESDTIPKNRTASYGQRHQP